MLLKSVFALKTQHNSLLDKNHNSSFLKNDIIINCVNENDLESDFAGISL